MNVKIFVSILIPSLILSACSLNPSSPSSSSPTPTPLLPQPTTALTSPLPSPSPLTPSLLPTSHQITTEFIPQAPEKNWDQPWQDACEEAALLTVHYYYQGLKPDLSQILNDYQNIFTFEQNQGWGHDVNLTQLSLIAQSLGYTAQIISDPTLETLKSYVSQNLPVIVPANGKTLYRENKHFKSGGPWYHQLVILGYNDSDGVFIVHDVGTQFGAYFKYSYSLLMESIHNWPSSNRKEDINLGDKSVMVLVK